MKRTLVLLIVVVAAALTAPLASAKPSKFVERLRAAAEPDEEPEAVEPDEGLNDPETEPPEPYHGEDDDEEGGRLPPHGLPAPEPPPVEPAADKPLERGPAEPARALPPAVPVE